MKEIQRPPMLVTQPCDMTDRSLMHSFITPGDQNGGCFHFTSGGTSDPLAGFQFNLLIGSTAVGNSPDYGSLAGFNDWDVQGAGYHSPNNVAYYGNTAFGSSLNPANPMTHGVVTITIPLCGGLYTPSAQGYDLSCIKVFSGWIDHASFADQNYTVSVSTDGTNFTGLHTVHYMPFLAANDAAANQGASALVTLTNLNPTGIKSIQFALSAGADANSQLQEGQLIQEIEVFGTPTGGAPPATATMVHRYNFATDASDSLNPGGAWDGLLQGGATVSGGQMVLNGTLNSYVQLPSGILSNYDAVTLETWVSFGPTLSTWAKLYDFGATDSGGAGYNCAEFTPHTGNGDTRLNLADGDPGFNHEQDVIYPTPMDGQTNVHIVVVYDPAAGYESLYLNGALAGINSRVTIPMKHIAPDHA